MTGKAENHDTQLFFNGINGATGDYGLKLSASQFSRLILDEADPEELERFRQIYHQMTLGTEKNPGLGPREGINAADLAQAGWGIIFAYDDRQQVPALKEALSPLLRLRGEQAGPRLRVFEGPDAYRPGETKAQFLARHGVGAGPVDPDKGVPYYLLLIGSPELIPYRVQYQLDIQFAVGRIHFDTLDAYERYAQSVLAAESGAVQLPRKVSLFGVANPDDRSTQVSSQRLVQPLYQRLCEWNDDQLQGWEVELFQGEGMASKAQLQDLLGGEQTPALLFTASHGMEFPEGDQRQIPHQGALLCQDWPGPEEWRQDFIPQDFYFAGDDLDSDAKLLGSFTFFFACYGAGTPLHDEFALQALKREATIAERPFVASLPKKLLGHPRGGALAAVSHVERAWGYSFFWPRAGEQTVVFESTLESLLKGKPIGLAVEYFNERYAELSAGLSEDLKHIVAGRSYQPLELAGSWTASHDARNYVIVGDPAVCLPVVEAGQEPAERPAIQVGSATLASAGAASQAAAQAALEETPPGKPIESISDGDWANTPPAVQRLLSQSVQLIKQLRAQLDRWEQNSGNHD